MSTPDNVVHTGVLGITPRKTFEYIGKEPLARLARFMCDELELDQLVFVFADEFGFNQPAVGYEADGTPIAAESNILCFAPDGQFHGSDNVLDHLNGAMEL